MPTSHTAFWICCRFPSLPLEALKASTVEDQPLVLVNASGSARTVLAANESAQLHGVRQGMPLNTAYSYCPHLQCSARQPQAEQQRLRQLADVAYGFTPDISLQPPDALLLECAGTLHLFNGETGLLRRLAETWSELGHQSDFGIAHTPLAATVLAHVPEVHSASDTPLPARVKQTLAHIKLKRLAGALWEPKVIERFAASGIHTLGAVLALPSAAVGRRFGRKLLMDLDRLSGTLADPRKYIRPSPYFHGSLSLLDPIRHRAGLAFPMHRLLRDLKTWLHARQLLTSGIEWRFSSDIRQPTNSTLNAATRFAERETVAEPKTDNHQKAGSRTNALFRAGSAEKERKERQEERLWDAHIEVRLAQPGMDDKRLLGLTDLQLERSTLPTEIVAIELRSLSLLSVASLAENRELFHSQHAHHSPETLLDLLQARFGAPALHGLALGDDHRPEYGWQPLSTPRLNVRTSLQSAPADSLTEQQPQPSFPRLLPQPSLPRLLPQPRPTWLLAQPQLLERQSFELLRGPERIEAAWWDIHASEPHMPITKNTQSAKCAQTSALASHSTSGLISEHALDAQTTLSATVTRDYYLARSSRGELCWIFHQHGSDNWFLHGYFA